MVGILTFHWADDCGGMLQAYALKRQLELLGEEAEIIPYAPVKLTGRYWVCPVCAERRREGLHYFLYRYMLARYLAMGGAYWRRRRRMRAFRRTYLTACPPIRRAADISLLPYRTVFVGSDQVWNPDITVDLDDAYVGNIPRRGACRLAAYAASLGGTSLGPEDREKFAKYVGGGFSAVSLRERTDAEQVEKLTGRPVRDVLDPVLLLDREEWEGLARPPAEGDAVVLYTTQPNGDLLRRARALSDCLGKRIVSLSRPDLLAEDPGDLEGIRMEPACGPREFLGWIQSACCVLTNSFHATAFSVLLEKPFLSFRHSARGVRQSDLLSKLGLLSLLWEPGREEENVWAETDWTEVRGRLAEERAASRRFMMENLGTEDQEEAYGEDHFNHCSRL